MKWRSGLFVGVMTLLVAAGTAAHFSKLQQSSRTPKPLKVAERQAQQLDAPVRRLFGSVRLLESGEGFHGAEIKALNGEKWLGLYITESGSELRESIIKIRFVNDPITDEDETSATGKSISVDQSDEPLLLVKNAAGLKPGPVTTIFHQKQDEFFSLSEHSIVSLNLGAQVYQLKLVGSGPGADSILPRDPQLFLTDGVTTQVLYSLEGEIGDADWSLRWAGDFDGDGKLDLYAELNPHYNVSARKLFLSSKAKPGQLVAEVAEFTTTGC